MADALGQALLLLQATLGAVAGAEVAAVAALTPSAGRPQAGGVSRGRLEIRVVDCTLCRIRGNYTRLSPLGLEILKGSNMARRMQPLPAYMSLTALYSSFSAVPTGVGGFNLTGNQNGAKMPIDI